MDYYKARKWLLKAAEQGSAVHQYELGVMYSYDNTANDESSYTEQMGWFRKAAEQGYAAAQYEIGVMYNNGNGVRENIDEARVWYKKSCYNGYQDGCDMYKILNK